MTLAEIQNLLNGLMRGIDKKTALRVEYRTDPERPGVEVHLTRDKRTGAVQFPEAALIEAQTDLIARNRLRTALKRSRDGMWEASNYIFSTKMERPKQEGGSWFRPQQSGRGRR